MLLCSGPECMLLNVMLGCRNMEAVKRDLEAARSEIMGPLSAASMESHSRAYPHLVQLHMLQVAPCQPARLAVWETTSAASLVLVAWLHFSSASGVGVTSFACCMVLLVVAACEDEEETVAILLGTEA